MADASAAFVTRPLALPVSLPAASSLRTCGAASRPGVQLARAAASRAVPSAAHGWPPAPAGRKPCYVLWLREGDLRLGDNCVVAAVAARKGFVLPVVTLQRGRVCERVLSAIRGLRAVLRGLGSDLVVWQVDSQFQAELRQVVSLCAQVGAREVYVHAGREVKVGRVVSAVCGGNVHVHVVPNGAGFLSNGPSPCLNGCSMLCQVPSCFPRLPPMASSVYSNLWLGNAPGEGEIAARDKLQRLLMQLAPGGSQRSRFQMLLHMLSEELRIGCLSVARVSYELGRRRFFNNVNVKPKSVGNGVMDRVPHSNVNANLPVFSAMSIAAYDVNGGDRRGVEWDEESKSFVLKEWEHTETERRMTPKERWNEFWRRRRLFFTRTFFPDDVTPDYYSFTAWRFAQRCCSATIGVFGTSSLLFAIGIKSGRIGQAAVISWVLKDGLGRVGKMIWAGSMGKDFDIDPKRWRFKSALLYALGNGLEIVTQIFPASFLVFATAANSMKQVSMLTASATRNAMYRSFGEHSQNIANITAKGEAQIVVADLIGMGCGIRLSKILGSSRKNVLGMYVILTCMDIFGIYMELRQVVFRSLNAERSSVMVNHYIRHGNVMTPLEVSRRERIFMKPRYMSHMHLCSVATAARDPAELAMLLRLFKREHFMVSLPQVPGSGPCRLVLRKDAKDEDVLRAMLMIGYVDLQLKGRKKKKTIDLEEEEHILKSAWKSMRRQFPSLMKDTRKAGWNTDNMLFNTLERRGYW